MKSSLLGALSAANLSLSSSTLAQESPVSRLGAQAFYSLAMKRVMQSALLLVGIVALPLTVSAANTSSTDFNIGIEFLGGFLTDDPMTPIVVFDENMFEGDFFLMLRA